MKFLQILVPLSLLFCGCKSKTRVVVNEHVIQLSSLHHEGKIKEMPSRDAFLKMFRGWFHDFFKPDGFDYRLDECMKNWKVFEDQGHFIIFGSVAKSDKDVSMFAWVIKNEKSGGYLDTVFLQIGDSVEKGSQYPKFLIPYKKF